MALRIGGLPGVGRIASALGLNTVPIAGVFAEGWSTSTALALYWIESVVAIVLVSLRIVLHRRMTRKAGHWNVTGESTITINGRTTKNRFKTTHLVSFLSVMIPFTLVHGIFLGILLFLVLPQEAGMPGATVSVADLRAGVVGVGILLLIGLLIDLVGLRDRPFRWIQRTTERTQGRIFVTHLTIIFGMFAAGLFGAPGALFAVFAGLKALVDLGGAFPEKELALEPPKWTGFLERFGKSKAGETFAEHWRRTELERRKQLEANEQLLDSGPSRA